MFVCLCLFGFWLCVFFFFFKQKTAYEMRISDWSSDVCSSDLVAPPVAVDPRGITRHLEHQVGVEPDQAVASARLAAFDRFEHPVAAPRLDQLDRKSVV